MRSTASGAVRFLPLFMLACLLAPERLSPAEGEGSVAGPGKQLVFPLLLWSRTFPEPVEGVAIARGSGEVAVNTMSKVYYFREEITRPPGEAVWIRGDSGEGWNHVEGLGISNDGSRVIYQTDTHKKRTTEGLNLTMHFIDGNGRVIWEKPNPYRYQKVLLSGSGKYIFLGEELHSGLKCHDVNLNLIWQKPVFLWYVALDPTEGYLFDGEGGLLYTIQGEQVWDFGRYTRILSVSDNAEFVMTQMYRTSKSGERMFLMARLLLKKIELAGTGGCVSPDGLLAAYVSSDKKLTVYRTRELLDAGGPSIPPLFSAFFFKPWSIQISRDNRSLFVMGQESAISSVMMLVDLAKMKIVWKRPVDDQLRIALPTDDNREVVIKPAPQVVTKFRCY